MRLFDPGRECPIASQNTGEAASLVGVPPMMRWTAISFQAEYHHPDAAARHSPCQIGCGNQWHQRSAGTADVSMPVDLEWPRRATVGANCCDRRDKDGELAEGTGVLCCGERPPGTFVRFNAPGQTILRLIRRDRLCSEKSDDCAVIDSPSNTGLSLVNSICEAVTTPQMRLQTSKREREVRSG